MTSEQDGRRTSRGGYWRWSYESTRDPATGEHDGMGYFMLGAHIVFSPIMAPLYWLGRLGSAAFTEEP